MSVRLLMVTAAACFLTAPLAAQVSSPRVVECGTTSFKRVQCNAGVAVTNARLVRDMSANRCSRDGSWGWTETFVWADNGCHGEFEVNYPTGPGTGNTRRITCGSLTTIQVECKTEGYATNVRMIREISRNRCRQGSNWGHTDSFIWTNDGCRAEFEVTYGGGATPLPAPVPGTSTRIISCGTPAGQQVTCKTGGYTTGVRLIRDLSGNRCRQGSNWGHTDSFIWVNQGCRGDFEVTYRGGTTPLPSPNTRLITCGSPSGQQVQCKTGGYTTSVRLVRDLSINRCRKGSNWGNTDSFIWANRGCRAEFEVTYRDGGPSTPGTRVITCGSGTNDQVQCNTGGNAADVRLVRDLSGNRCRQGSNWGYTTSVIWTNRSCRAEFEVTYRGGPQLKPVPLPAPVPTPNTRVISCGNASGSAMSCNAFGTVASMRLQRDRSAGRCNQSSAWGLENASIWVARGCYGDFEVTFTTTPQQR